MSADGQATIGLKYDFSSQEFQGINTADLLLTTTGQPVAKVSSAEIVPQSGYAAVLAMIDSYVGHTIRFSCKPK